MPGTTEVVLEKMVLWTRREPAWGFRILSRTLFGRNYGFSPLDRIQLCPPASCRVHSSTIVSFLPNSRKPFLPKSLTIRPLCFSLLTPMPDIGPWCNKNGPTKRVGAVVLRLFGDFRSGLRLGGYLPSRTGEMMRVSPVSGRG